jgi:hypothetical protein
LYLTLVFPDGSRAEIPAAWTNLHNTHPQKNALQATKIQPDLIATATDLLHTRKIVDHLLGNLLSSEQKSQTVSGKEINYAQAVESMACQRRTQSGGLAISGAKPARPNKNITGPPDPKNALRERSCSNQRQGGQR